MAPGRDFVAQWWASCSMVSLHGSRLNSKAPGRALIDTKWASTAPKVSSPQAAGWALRLHVQASSLQGESLWLQGGHRSFRMSLCSSRMSVNGSKICVHGSKESLQGSKVTNMAHVEPQWHQGKSSWLWVSLHGSRVSLLGLSENIHDYLLNSMLPD
jgi:hypothetical protein